MDHVELVILFLLVAVAAVGALARIIGVPYPILLVVGGCLAGFVPGVPDVELEPDLVLLIFLPPLLFNAAYFSSARDLRRNARTITLNAVGLVLLTAALVAVAAHATIDGLSWAAAFALGAIVSPTDPLAATAIASRLGVPQRLIAAIEGESLVNDGTALVAYRVAVAAAVGGSFDLLDASSDFVVNALGGIAVGFVVGKLMVLVFRHIVEDDVVGVTTSLAAGYVGYLPAEHLGVSGVLAAVFVGLVVGRRSPEIVTPSARLRGYAFWEVLVFLLNATLFLLVGMQLPGILEDQDRSAGTLIGLGVLISVTVIGSRLLWLNTVPYVIRAIDRRPEQRLRRIGWRPRLVAAWSGLRGAVSLAAALALPEDFPERDLLVFLTLCVIFSTLVFQGLTLPWVIRMLGVEDDGEGEREELLARREAAEAAIVHLERLAEEEWTRTRTVERMAGMYRFRRARIAQRIGEEGDWYVPDDGEDDDDRWADLDGRSNAYQRVVREALEAQRRRIIELRDAGEISDSVLHVLERELDLEDQRLEI
ncbi:Na+/H+ antiporter [Conexibacter sp. SYSU D00693]|uniref:Na+/H+ antiporter n=1 Tax=Conexibacter sp. SYSU D00693 TaxID=2812560 RepID=UPI00196BA36C|nr:Na+/H+ antiporter [Conexibacter sp. SYSU D00693]